MALLQCCSERYYRSEFVSSNKTMPAEGLSAPSNIGFCKPKLLTMDDLGHTLRRDIRN